MEPHRALVIEDAADVRLLLCEVLQKSGFEVWEAATGQRGLDRVDEVEPDLITLDLTLPDLDGIEVCRRLRTMTTAYIVVLTARLEEADRLVGLEVGADDYVTKPFSVLEFRARVAAMFRRPRTAATSEGRKPKTLRFGELAIDEESREVRLSGRLVDLTKIEFELLAILASNPRRVWERETLTRLVWRTEWPGNDHVIDVHIANLRRKLGDDARSGRWIRTVHGVGYRLGE
ncbi:response regulator transcription factor [Actinomadura rudentiformis]|uniref:Response regulator transcription factor n=1 Tax=Actinomadura rudentiformis TaxID=359158 RepID=A0A6H9YWF5_9ACTN|nr:response regulator transcription factor [Actinomadura rudentiformis]KAB2349076.1 response regulator transcription factor [Actinomadura rudentiformis]